MRKRFAPVLVLLTLVLVLALVLVLVLVLMLPLVLALVVLPVLALVPTLLALLRYLLPMRVVVVVMIPMCFRLLRLSARHPSLLTPPRTITNRNAGRRAKIGRCVVFVIFRLCAPEKVPIRGDKCDSMNVRVYLSVYQCNI